MTPDTDGLPKLGPSARTLGVRVPQDVNPDETGHVTPGSGGMSVAPDTMWNLPHHRRPRGIGRGSTGPDQDHLFSLALAELHETVLAVRHDPKAPAVHAFVEPKFRMLLADFERGLATTRPRWARVWP